MIRAVAVDMDGTFLNNQGSYDYARFENIYKKLKDQNVRFIVASGNQYAQLKSFFPELDKDIYFISENGALIFENNRLIKESHFDLATVREILTFLKEKYPNTSIILSGINKAYIEEDTTENFKDIARTYYYQLEEVKDLSLLKEEKYVKFSLSVPNEATAEVTDELLERFDGKAVAVSSGHGSVDIILPGAHKANALRYLANRWGISPEEILAFGDGDNDSELLEYASHSYAMKNGSQLVKNSAKYTAPNNDESGVLQILEKYFQ